MSPDAGVKQRHAFAVYSEIFLAYRIVVRIRFNCDDMGSREFAEEIDRRIANIRSTINDQLWLADIQQTVICLPHEDLLEDVEITRGVPGIDRTATAATAQGDSSSVDCGETKAT